MNDGEDDNLSSINDKNIEMDENESKAVKAKPKASKKDKKVYNKRC